MEARRAVLSFAAVTALVAACGGATASEADSLATSPIPIQETFACTCQRACIKLVEDHRGSCYGDCAEAPEACRSFFECALSGNAACSFGGCADGEPCECGRWYHGGGACVQDFTPPPTGDCPDRCTPSPPRCRPGTHLAEGRCQPDT